MPQAAKSFLPSTLQRRIEAWVSLSLTPQSRTPLALHVIVAYALIEVIVWTPVGQLNALCISLTGAWILWATYGGRFTTREMGIAPPPAAASLRIFLGGVALAALLPLLAVLWRNNSGPSHVLPVGQALAYSVWALLQQFILQSFFYVRLESLLGGRWAVPAAAFLFGSVHFPSLLLTLASFAGGLFFCEMFRRYRNIFPLGLIHAVLGLTLAASFSDAILHHMRVGLGYVRFHP